MVNKEKSIQSPEFCESCDRKPGGYCRSYDTCEKWCTWFKKEWRSIRADAERAKERKRYAR